MEDVVKNDVYADLVDIRHVKLKEGASRKDNAEFFLKQIKNPTTFRYDEDVVILEFEEKGLSLSDAIAKILEANL